MVPRKGSQAVRDMTIIIDQNPQVKKAVKGRLYYNMLENRGWRPVNGQQPYYDIPPSTAPFLQYTQFLCNAIQDVDLGYWVRSVRHPTNGFYYWVAITPVDSKGNKQWGETKAIDSRFLPDEYHAWVAAQPKQTTKSVLDLLVF